jgi:hypothetical protein
VLCGNTLPIILTDPKYKSELLFLSTCLSSFAFDYIARQKVGGIHMNSFVLKQLPVLPPKSFVESCEWNQEHTIGNWILLRALELTYTAWDLEAFAKDCGYDGPPFRWDEERRFLLRCELDAAYFHLYGIARDDVCGLYHGYLQGVERKRGEAEGRVSHEARDFGDLGRDAASDGERPGVSHAAGAGTG